MNTGLTWQSPALSPSPPSPSIPRPRPPSTRGRTRRRLQEHGRGRELERGEHGADVNFAPSSPPSPSTPRPRPPSTRGRLRRRLQEHGRRRELERDEHGADVSIRRAASAPSPSTPRPRPPSTPGRMTDGVFKWTATPPQPAETRPRGGGGGGGGGGCFIATAAYGSPPEPPRTNAPGLPRSLSHDHRRRQGTRRSVRDVIPPRSAARIARHESLKWATRAGLTPVVYTIRYPVPAGAALLVTLVVTGWALQTPRARGRRGHARTADSARAHLTAGPRGRVRSASPVATQRPRGLLRGGSTAPQREFSPTAAGSGARARSSWFSEFPPADRSAAERGELGTYRAAPGAAGRRDACAWRKRSRR